MKVKYHRLPLRSGVGIVVLNKENKVFVAKRIDNPKNFWQMPQGGINEGEDYYSAALRELKEETSIVSVKHIKEIEEKLTYILPDHLIGIIWKGKFKGQRQKWFVMRFIGNEAEKESHNQDMSDQAKYLVDHKIEVLKSLTLN